MNQSVFDHTSYKKYMQVRLGGPLKRSGEKSKAAVAMNCQPAYLSQVMNANAHLSLEQADALNRYLHHSKDEAQFFLLLVQRERAGTQSLRTYFQEQIEAELEKRLNLTRRLGASSQLSREHQAKYYSSWHYAALHIALTIPSLRTREALAEHFRISMQKTVQVLDFFLEVGLAKRNRDGTFEPGSSFLRLGNESPHISHHHSNLRALAVDSFDREDARDLHYSGIVSLSKKDVLKLKSQMLEQIKDNIAVVRESKEEELYCYCVDFFSTRR